MENSNWKETQAIYRQMLFATAAEAREQGARNS
jgi:hypothetical protein